MMLKRATKLSPRLCSLLFTSAILPSISFANTPSEMADLSLQELFALSTDDMDEQIYETWQFNFLYKRSELDGYLDGSSKVSDQDVLFDGNEARTSKNFPVLPTVISQETYIANIRYFLGVDQNISISIPYIEQSTDHESIVPGYDEFNISSDGIGDVTVNYTGLITRWDRHRVSYSLGLSFPLGSIDEEGDTPRGEGNQQLPYTMQLGSGTWDIPVGISYSEDKTGYGWGANIFTKVRMGKNDRDYRLGNRFAMSVWNKWYLNETFHPLVKVVYQDWGHIFGQDDEITVPNPKYPYPAGITNPMYYGGQKVNLVVGGDFFFGSQVFSVEIGAPLYQNLNGVQPKENINFSVNWQSNL